MTFHMGFFAQEFWVDDIRFYEGDYVPTVVDPKLGAQMPTPDSKRRGCASRRGPELEAGPVRRDARRVLRAPALTMSTTPTPPIRSSLLVSQARTATPTIRPAFWNLARPTTGGSMRSMPRPTRPSIKGDVWSFTTEPYGYPVKPIKATASSSFTATMGPEKTIDGSGLDANDQHSVSASQMWLSKKGQSPIWIQYEFDKAYKLYQMWVWNSNQAVESISRLWGQGRDDRVLHGRHHLDGPGRTCRSSPRPPASRTTPTTPPWISAACRPSTSS